MAKAPTHYKVTLLLPMADNDGTPFDLRIWTWWSRSLAEVVAAFTEYGVVQGVWRGQTDQNRMFAIVVRTLAEVDALRRLLREARLRFRQEAMYLDYHRVFFEEVSD